MRGLGPVQRVSHDAGADGEQSLFELGDEFRVPFRDIASLSRILNHVKELKACVSATLDDRDPGFLEHVQPDEGPAQFLGFRVVEPFEEVPVRRARAKRNL